MRIGWCLAALVLVAGFASAQADDGASSLFRRADWLQQVASGAYGDPTGFDWSAVPPTAWDSIEPSSWSSMSPELWGALPQEAWAAMPDTTWNALPAGAWGYVPASLWSLPIEFAPPDLGSFHGGWSPAMCDPGELEACAPAGFSLTQACSATDLPAEAGAWCARALARDRSMSKTPEPSPPTKPTPPTPPTKPTPKPNATTNPRAPPPAEPDAADASAGADESSAEEVGPNAIDEPAPLRRMQGANVSFIERPPWWAYASLVGVGLAVLLATIALARTRKAKARPPTLPTQPVASAPAPATPPAQTPGADET